jgi:hypothetical protein
VADPAAEPNTAGEEAYLRFGMAREEGSYNAVRGEAVGGVSVFGATKQGSRYLLDLPTELEYVGLTSTLVSLMCAGRPLYLATGTYIGKNEEDGEPLLENVALKRAPRFTSVELPSWLGKRGEAFGRGWSKWWRGPGHGTAGGPPQGLGSWGLMEAGARVVAEFWRLRGPEAADEMGEDWTPSELYERAFEEKLDELREWKRACVRDFRDTV